MLTTLQNPVNLADMSSSESSTYTTREAAKYLGISTSTLYRMVHQGLIRPAITPGRQRRFTKPQLDDCRVKSTESVAPQKPRSLRSRYRQAEPDAALLCDPAETLELDLGLDSSPAASQGGEPDPRNKLNALDGKQWLVETKSVWFQKGLGAAHPHAKYERLHPAPFSFQDVARLIQFFTRPGELVLDPFSGVGSTMKACAITGRRGKAIELSEHWMSLAKRRLDEEVSAGAAAKFEWITADAREALRQMPDGAFDFVVTSPPYWAILSKDGDHKVRKERIANGLVTRYSSDATDLGNIRRYDDFLNELTGVFLQVGRVLRPERYMAVIVSDFRHRSTFISFHSDLIRSLNGAKIGSRHRLVLQGTKILSQNHKKLYPYGYPFAYVENIHHQYILILRKTAETTFKRQYEL
ncbi:MAG: DNA methyltransferase [bacterium]|nr:DNA methyltransferase [bacterium]